MEKWIDELYGEIDTANTEYDFSDRQAIDDADEALLMEKYLADDIDD